MEICHNVDFQLCKKKLWPRLVFIYWCFDSLTLRSVFPVKCWEYCNKAQCCIKSEAQTGECGRLNSGWVVILILGGFCICLHYCSQKWLTNLKLTILISLINMKSRLPILKNSTLHKTISPSSYINFLDFFHSQLLVYCI